MGNILNSLTQVETSMMWLIVAMKRVDWAAERFHRFQALPAWEELERHAASAKVLNEAGANVHAYFVTKGLKTAVETASLALRNWNGTDGFVPCEVLLRSALIGASKALYLLGPDELEVRERRTSLVYQSDRNAKEYAIHKDWTLQGKDVDQQQKNKPGIPESKVIRDALDGFVANGNCNCGRPDCPQEDLELLRHRLLQAWWIYSSVSHANLWHLELSTGISLDGERKPAGDFGVMAADIAWVICKAVETLYRRYDMDEHLIPLEIDFQQIAERLRNNRH